MFDAQGRNIEYLRISITDRCNLRCTYCMPKDGGCLLGEADVLTGEEIGRTAAILAEHCGIKQIRLTGGEPLVRRDCADLIQILKNTAGIERVTLTTNGVELKEQLPALLAAGIDGINVSLDTMSSERFYKLTGRDCLNRVLVGIEAAENSGIPLHINCVAARQIKDVPKNERAGHREGIGEREADVLAVAALAKREAVAVRFIEMMPIGQGGAVPSYREEELRDILENTYGKLTPCAAPEGSGPANYYQMDGFAGKIGFISAMSHRFCGTCNRIRLTADGRLKTCLQYEPELSVRELLRDGSSDERIAEALKRVIFEKKAGHHFGEMCAEDSCAANKESRNMSQIGG